MKIGKINYLNCLPYYAGWENSADYEMVEGHPAAINEMMRTGIVDAGPISSMEYLMHPQEYRLLSEMGIASTQLVRSVTLFSKKKIEALGGASIAVTDQSLTSVYLLDLLLRERFGLEATLVKSPSNPKVMLEHDDAALLIGDDALFAKPKSWIFRYDLGGLWFDWQKLSFVFAVWAVRKTAAVSETQIASFQEALRERLTYNLKNLANCIRDHYHIAEFDRRYPKIYGYLNNLRYELDETCMSGLQKFAELSAHKGWCQKLDADFAGAMR